VDDEASPLSAPPVRFGPDLRLTALIFVGALATLTIALTTGDPVGRLVFLAATVVLLGYVACDVVFRPRLAADATGLEIRTPLARTKLAWDDIDEVRADVRNRLGLRSITLEVDAGETLVVFSRRALGADPAVVTDLVRSMDPRYEIREPGGAESG
jgi:hypothetical protein